MLIEVTAKEFKHHFGSDPNPFISESFLELNRGKVDRIVRLIEDTDKVSIGLAAGIMNGIIKAPFSAPFGGFHFRHESIYINEIDRFLSNLKEYATKLGIGKIILILPPSLYQQSFNAKLMNSLIRLGFTMKLPEVTNWVSLIQFNGEFSHRNSREYYRQAVRNGLKFNVLKNKDEQFLAYELIRKNRLSFGRSIYMTFDDIIQTSKLWPVEFFSINDFDGQMVSSGIFYQFPQKLTYAVFWGDNEMGRPLRAMDFLVYHLWNYFKSSGFEFIDLGISSEDGLPNEGLLRFKETHECVSSLRFSFTWDKESKQ